MCLAERFELVRGLVDSSVIGGTPLRSGELQISEIDATKMAESSVLWKKVWQRLEGRHGDA